MMSFAFYPFSRIWAVATATRRALVVPTTQQQGMCRGGRLEQPDTSHNTPAPGSGIPHSHARGGVFM
jgi:hypothetical protein